MNREELDKTIDIVNRKLKKYKTPILSTEDFLMATQGLVFSTMPACVVTNMNVKDFDKADSEVWGLISLLDEIHFHGLNVYYFDEYIRSLHRMSEFYKKEGYDHLEKYKKEFGVDKDIHAAVRKDIEEDKYKEWNL